MDLTSILNIVAQVTAPLAMALCGFFWRELKELRSDLSKHKDVQNEFEKSILQHYARKDELKETVKDFKDMVHSQLQLINQTVSTLFTKVDTLAERINIAKE